MIQQTYSENSLLYFIYISIYILFIELPQIVLYLSVACLSKFIKTVFPGYFLDSHIDYLIPCRREAGEDQGWCCRRCSGCQTRDTNKYIIKHDFHELNKQFRHRRKLNSPVNCFFQYFARAKTNIRLDLIETHDVATSHPFGTSPYWKKICNQFWPPS